MGSMEHSGLQAAAKGANQGGMLLPAPGPTVTTEGQAPVLDWTMTALDPGGRPTEPTLAKDRWLPLWAACTEVCDLADLRARHQQQQQQQQMTAHCRPSRPAANLAWSAVPLNNVMRCLVEACQKSFAALQGAQVHGLQKMKSDEEAATGVHLRLSVLLEFAPKVDKMMCSPNVGPV